MTIMAHIDEQVAASALGALSPDEQRQVEEHCAICPTCNELLEETQQTAQMLAWSAPAIKPPVWCKTGLMQRIDDAQFLQSPTPKRNRLPAWSGWAFAGVVVLFMMTWNIQLQRRLEYANMVGTMFVAEPVSRVLEPMDQAHKYVKAKMYMSPNSSYIVLVMENVQPAPEGKVYRVWMANETTKSPTVSFAIANNQEPMVITPPQPVGMYKWIMITMEDADDMASPDDTTILRGNL